MLFPISLQWISYHVFYCTCQQFKAMHWLFCCFSDKSVILSHWDHHTVFPLSGMLFSLTTYVTFFKSLLKCHIFLPVLIIVYLPYCCYYVAIVNEIFLMLYVLYAYRLSIEILLVFIDFIWLYWSCIHLPCWIQLFNS